MISFPHTEAPDVKQNPPAPAVPTMVYDDVLKRWLERTKGETDLASICDATVRKYVVILLSAVDGDRPHDEAAAGCAFYV